MKLKPSEPIEFYDDLCERVANRLDVNDDARSEAVGTQLIEVLALLADVDA